MANYFCEMFGYIYYNDALTYEQLLKRENYLIDDFKNVLMEHKAVHINNIPLGDALLVQCSFSAYDDYLFEKLCDDLHTILCEYVYCKLLFVDKSLDFMHICRLTHLGWEESTLHFPISPKHESPQKFAAVNDTNFNKACEIYNNEQAALTEDGDNLDADASIIKTSNSDFKNKTE